MELAEVEEYKARELHMTSNIAKRIRKSNKPFSAKDFYPEYGLKDVYKTSLEPYTKIWEQLPFHRKLIVHVTTALPNHSSFQKWYGVSVDQLIDLQKQNKVEVMLILPHEDTSLPDYLGPILIRKYPTSLRLHGCQNILLEDRHLDFQDQIEETARKFGMSVNGLGKLVPESQQRIYRTTRVALLQLLSLGYEKELFDVTIVANVDAEGARRLLDLYRLFLAGPFYYSLDGMHTVSEKALVENDLGEVFKRTTLETSKGVKVFPSEVAKVLVSKLELVKPRGLDFALDIYPDYEKAAHALTELNKYLQEETDREEIKDRGQALKDAMYEILSGMEEEGKKWERALEVLCIAGASAAGGALAGLPGLFSTLWASLLGSSYVASSLSEKIVRLRRSSHIVSVFDFKREVDRWKLTVGVQ